MPPPRVYRDPGVCRLGQGGQGHRGATVQAATSSSPFRQSCSPGRSTLDQAQPGTNGELPAAGGAGLPPGGEEAGGSLRPKERPWGWRDRPASRTKPSPSLEGWGALCQPHQACTPTLPASRWGPWAQVWGVWELGLEAALLLTPWSGRCPLCLGFCL